MSTSDARFAIALLIAHRLMLNFTLTIPATGEWDTGSASGNVMSVETFSIVLTRRRCAGRAVLASTCLAFNHREPCLDCRQTPHDLPADFAGTAHCAFHGLSY